MRHARRAGLAVLAAGLWAVAVSGEPAAEPKVTANAVSYADLGREVRALRGKVVLVDFWSIY
jgi:hypothetical protein